MPALQLGILVAAKPGVSETFINNHIHQLPFQNTVIYGDPIPYRTDLSRPRRLRRRIFQAREYVTKERGVFERHLLKKELESRGIQVALAEFLTTAGQVVDTCEAAGVPLVATCLGYDISMQSVIDKHERSYRNLFAKAHSIIIVSNHMRENLNRLGCPENKIVFSPAGPDQSFFALTPSFDNQTILAVGRLVDKKAPHLTILAFSKLLDSVPNAQLVYAGDGPLRGVCEDLVQSLDLSGKVHLLGSIDQDRQRELLQSCAVFAQHSVTALNGDSEGTPVALLEASAAGVPVVSTRHAGIVEVVVDGETGLLVDERDVEGMSRHLRTLLLDPALARALGAKGRALVHSRFSLKDHLLAVGGAIERAARSRDT